MEPEVVIRLADEQDLDSIRAFGAVVVPAHYDPIIGPAAAQEQVDLWWTRERLLAALSDGVLLVAEADGELVGVAEVGAWDGDPVIWKLYVRPGHRGRGIGRMLLLSAISEVPREASRVVLEHFAGNERAGAFYQREGFEHLRTDPAVSGEPAAATVWRVLDLTTGSDGAPSELTAARDHVRSSSSRSISRGP
jgi:ribosomal protein S18 acetylase RimI-like enzyme